MAGTSPVTPPNTGGARRRAATGTRTRTVVGIAAALIAVSTVAAVAVTRLGADDGCDAANQQAQQLRVVTAPELAPVVKSVAKRLETNRPCLEVEIEAAAPVDVVAGLTAGSIEPPDVWIPDSSLWLTRAEVDALATVTEAPSVATSPLVIAMSQATADSMGSGPLGRRPAMADLVAAASAHGGLTVAMSEERLSPARVGAILALSAATEGQADARAALTALLRAVNPIEDSAAAEAATHRGTVVALPEQSVWSANRAQDLGLVAVYPGAVAYDYPYAVLTQDPARAALANHLLEHLDAAAGRQAVVNAGFRDRIGSPSRVVGSQAGADGTQVVATTPLGTQSLDLAERTLAAVNQDARLLAVMDVSGSMAWPVSGKGGRGPSRVSIAMRAAAEGMSFYPDTTEVGLWLFPGPVPGQTHQQIAPVRTLGERARRQLAGVLTRTTAIPDGNTPLYAATAAAVRAHQRGWSPERINAVIVLSDGQNTVDRPGGLPRLLEDLRAVRTSKRPVPVITVAFGPEADAESLARIARASGGAFYSANEAESVQAIFLDALGQRVCRPQCAA